MKNKMASESHAGNKVEGVLDPARAVAADAGIPALPPTSDAERPWHWTTALLLALLVHVAFFFLFVHIRREPPRSEAFEVEIVTLGNTMQDAAKGPADGIDDPDSSATAPAPEEKAVNQRPPDGERAPQTAQAETPPTPAAPAPPTPTPKPPAPAPKPARPAPPKVVETPAPPRAANPPLAEAVPLPQAKVPDLRYDVPEAHAETAPVDPGLASLPAHVSARLGAIGGGAVWQKGPPPKDAGMVPWGSDYWQRLMAWVKDHGRYPPQAVPKRLEGKVLIEFVIDRSGKVLTYRLLQSSGHTILDFEAKRMIQWSDPVPPLPPELKGEYRDVIIEVTFELYS